MPGAMLATQDMDLLWDGRPRLSLVVTEAEARGVLGILRSVDSSFKPVSPRSFRAGNDDGYLVDLIRPNEPDLRRPALEKIGRDGEDLYAVGIEGLQWLVSAPKIEETVIGSDGMPLSMCCIDPRAFALHKLWVSKRSDRNPAQRPRDEEQAIAVAALASSHLNLSFESKGLSALPKELRQFGSDLKKKARAWLKENQPDID